MKTFFILSAISLAACGQMSAQTLPICPDIPLAQIDSLSRQTIDNKFAPDRAERDLWLSILAEAHTNHQKVKKSVTTFMQRFPESMHNLDAKLLLAELWLAENPQKALDIYNEIDINQLSAHQYRLFTYHKAYALLKAEQPDKAQNLFASLQYDKQFGAYANYYLGTIAYDGQAWQKAKEYLQRVQSAGVLPGSVPYLLCEIYYQTGDYMQALLAAEGLLKRNVTSEKILTEEMLRIAGESAFELGETKKGIDYLTQYVEMSSSAAPSALYLLGRELQINGENEKAAKWLEKAAEHTPSAMTQSANLYLGQALEALGQNKAAILAYDKALKMDFDNNAREAAFYNYAVAKFSGATVPFGNTAAVFEEYLTLFPSGTHAAEVQKYLVIGYLNDHDYEGAISSINKMTNPPAAVLRAKQLALYALGTRALRAGNIALAKDFLTQGRSLANYDQYTDQHIALALGETLAAEGNHRQAIKLFDEFIAAKPEELNLPVAYYDKGYSQLALKDFHGAEESFQKFISNPGEWPVSSLADATTRRADALFYLKRFDEALMLYQRAYELQPQSSDYQLYQQGIIYGFQNKTAQKIESMKEFEELFPGSSLVPDALLETTEAYLRQGDRQGALRVYRRLVSEFPATEQGRKGYLQMALTRLNSGDRSGAIADYKEIVALYPTSEEARMAVDELKRLGAEDGNIKAVGSWLATIDAAPQLDVNEADQLSFDAAEKDFLTKGRVDKMQRYLIDYPQGASLAQALDYMMEASLQQGKDGDALTFANRIIKDFPDSRHAPAAMLVKAQDALNRGESAQAVELFKALETKASSASLQTEARIGLLRAYRDMADDDNVIKTANAMLASADAVAEYNSEILFSLGQAQYNKSQAHQARETWAKLPQQMDDVYWVKAYILEAQTLFDEKEYSTAQNNLESLIELGTPHTYWLGRAFILLSDIYQAQGKTYEAREYLKSLKANYPGSETDIFMMIDERLNNLK